MTDRRSLGRREIEVLFNKYIDGHPHLCRVLDLSATGLSAVQIGGPERRPDTFAVELRLPGDGRVLWVWARSVWKRGRSEGLEFVGLSATDARRIDRYLRVRSAHAAHA
jgi:hypothetical protein